MQQTDKNYTIMFIHSISQRELNRWSQFSEQKLRFFSKVKIKKNAFNKKDYGHIGFIEDKKKFGVAVIIYY